MDLALGESVTNGATPSSFIQFRWNSLKQKAYVNVMAPEHETPVSMLLSSQLDEKVQSVKETPGWKIPLLPLANKYL